jgi:hypothetical protein
MLAEIRGQCRRGGLYTQSESAPPVSISTA